MASSAFPHPEEPTLRDATFAAAPQGKLRASRRTQRRLARLVPIGAALLLAACTPEEAASVPAKPLGVRQPLHTGLWRGEMGGTMVDFSVDRVSPSEVNVHISGQVIEPLPKQSQPPGYQSYFYDRPKVCSIKYDRYTFDCPHYTDMHIDNGLLCGTYTLNASVYRPCFQPVR